MKTLKLIEQYKSLLEQDEIEQVEEVDVEVADATDVADVPEGPQGITPEGEIYVADLLTNAFIYAPKMKDINIAAIPKEAPNRPIVAVNRFLGQAI